jgi:hypothetical protein
MYEYSYVIQRIVARNGFSAALTSGLRDFLQRLYRCKNFKLLCNEVKLRKDDFMKKKIAALLVVFIMGSTVAYAQDYEYQGYLPHLIAGPIGIAGGGILLFTSEPDSTGQMLGWILLGAGVLDLGLGLLFWALDEPAYISEVQNNPVLQYVSLSAGNDRVYLGARFDLE